MEANSFVSAIYYLFVTHYIFNISYNIKLKDVMFFIQEKIFKIEDSTFKKSAIYSTTSSAIECYLDES